MRECEQTENILEEVKEDDMLSVLLGKKDLFDWHVGCVYLGLMEGELLGESD